jgi:hypothetical protein
LGQFTVVRGLVLWLLPSNIGEIVRNLISGAHAPGVAVQYCRVRFTQQKHTAISNIINRHRDFIANPIPVPPPKKEDAASFKPSNAIVTLRLRRVGMGCKTIQSW